MRADKVPSELDDQAVRKIAAEANVDPRTVRRALEGRTRSRATRDAIIAALRKLRFAEHAKKIEATT